MSNISPIVQVETNILPKPKLIIVFGGLAFSLLVSFIDQNSVGVALPSIGQDLNAASTIAWAGTSSLIANTVFQVLYGRLSDILGRKVVFLTAIALLAVGDLLCGFARTGTQLYVFRGISGVGNGGITALAMMIVSDIVTLEDRGKYQGILGSCVGLGNTIGPFLAAAFVSHSTWRGLFWTICPLATVSAVIIALILPPSRTTGTKKDKIKAIDYFGILTSSIGIILLLIPISGGGVYFEWNSPMVISMLVLASIALTLFIMVEWRWANVPMMPLHVFKNPPVCAIIIQNFLFGIVYYSHLYFLPIYYQNARQFSSITAAALTIPFVASQSVFSVCSGQYISRFKRYGEVIWMGYGLWTLGTGLCLLFSRTLPPFAIVLILIVEGAGVGFVFQPTLVAAQAHSPKHDRAVVISIRNFSRSLGGATGLAISSSVFSNTLASHTNSLPSSLRTLVLKSVYSPPEYSTMSTDQRNIILDAYTAASHAVYTMWVPFMGACLILCFLIKDRGLQRQEEATNKQSIQVLSSQSGEALKEKNKKLVTEQIPSSLESMEDLEIKEGYPSSHITSKVTQDC